MEEINLSEEDVENVKEVVKELIDVIVKFSATEKWSPNDLGDLKSVLDFAQFVISGVIYSNGMDVCDHEHDEEDDD